MGSRHRRSDHGNDQREHGAVGTGHHRQCELGYWNRAHDDTFRTQMINDAADESDDGITASLPTLAQFSGNLPPGFSFAAGGLVQSTTANAKALGFGVPAGPDGTITFSTNFAFDFDNSDGVMGTQMDFEMVAVHEIGHVLGFYSEVDFIDFVLSPPPGVSNQIWPTTLDLFRFDDAASNNPTDAAGFTTEPRSMIPGNEEHFDQISAAYGDTEVLLSTGLTQGDGRQASHWKDNLGLGVMDPTFALGELTAISLNDLRALDVIGYEITAIPEARAWLCGAVVICLSCLGSVVRRRWAAAFA